LANYELVITWGDGTNRTYVYPTLGKAISHAIEIASNDVVTNIEVWFTQRIREFAYEPPPKARGL